MKKSIRLLISLLLIFSLFATIPVASAEGTAATVEVALPEVLTDGDTSTDSSATVVSESDIASDFNGDGFVSSDDVQLVLKAASGHIDATDGMDLNGDGIISIDDAQLVYLDTRNYLSDDEYMQMLADLGFPKSYVESLLELHKKYPQWEFVPFITNLTWEEAVEGEHTPHKKQLIENIVSDNLMCDCSACDGVIQEASNWVSASEEAVRYYLDPRNFLTEEYIFQFESTAYDSSHTIEAVEAILDSTWMHDSEITYLDANGNTKTYKKGGVAIKYSEAIMEAAESSGMSAYYLASKIVQEVGSSSSSYAGGSSGKNSPYDGIYNYYNIGAYTGAGDGLRWANGYMKAKVDATMYKTTSAGSAVVKTIPKGTELNYASMSGDFYRVSANVSGTKYTGYINKSQVSVSNSYGRPWDSPYKSIYYGAQYIYSSFSEYQFTGYLQKFNVNAESGSLYSHEYMANIRAAATESQKTYKAYNECNVLQDKKVFSIPVFKDMPYGDLTREEAFMEAVPDVSATSTTTSVTLKWDAVKDAFRYQVFKYNESEKAYERIGIATTTSYTDSGLSSGETAKYRIRAYNKDAEGEYVFSKYSEVFYAVTSPSTPSGFKVVSTDDNSVKLKWNSVKCKGYQVYRYNSVGGYTLAGTVTDTEFYDTSLLSGSTYSYKVCAFYETEDMTATSAQTSALKVTTTGQAQLTGVVTVNDSLNIRSDASTSASIIITASSGQVVLILETLEGWYKVQFTVNDVTYIGYASADYVKVEEVKEECPYTEPTVTLRNGDSGEGVKWLQWHLSQLGYLEESDVDGAFGNMTDTAVREFQADKSLDVDGLVGSGTRSALKNAI